MRKIELRELLAIDDVDPSLYYLRTHVRFQAFVSWLAWLNNAIAVSATLPFVSRECECHVRRTGLSSPHRLTDRRMDVRAALGWGLS